MQYNRSMEWADRNNLIKRTLNIFQLLKSAAMHEVSRDSSVMG